jgi:hypothetical protein
MPVGTTSVDFGASGSKVAQVTVTGQTGLASGSHVEAFVMAESTADHNAVEHRLAPIKLVCGAVVADAGFTIYAASEWTLTGSFAVRWVWA